SEEHTSELQSREKLVCRLLLEKKTSPPAAGCAQQPYRPPCPGGHTERGRPRAGRGRWPPRAAAAPMAARDVHRGVRAGRPQPLRHRPHHRGALPHAARPAPALRLPPSGDAVLPAPPRPAGRRRRRAQLPPGRPAPVGRDLFFLLLGRPPRPTLFPYTTLFR